MKDWMKYLMSTLIFFVTFILMQYLLTESIDWKIIITSTIIYGIINSLCQIVLNKKIKIN